MYEEFSPGSYLAATWKFSRMELIVEIEGTGPLQVLNCLYLCLPWFFFALAIKLDCFGQSSVWAHHCNGCCFGIWLSATSSIQTILYRTRFNQALKMNLNWSWNYFHWVVFLGKQGENYSLQSSSESQNFLFWPLCSSFRLDCSVGHFHCSCH